MSETLPSIIVEYKNERPVELLDLTASLAALGEQFKDFVAQHGPATDPPALFIHEMRPGSIIAELIAWLQQADFALDHRERIAAFMAQWQEILQAVLNLSGRARELPKATLRNARAFVTATAKDNGSQLNLIAQDNSTQNVVINVINLTSDDAEKISRNAGYLLARGVPTEEPFASEPLTLYQMRDARAGDMGYIDRFTERPMKLTFASEETKNSILHHSDNPWDTIFFVSGVVKTSKGQVAAYHIRELNDVAPKNAA